MSCGSRRTWEYDFKGLPGGKGQFYVPNHSPTSLASFGMLVYFEAQSSVLTEMPVLPLWAWCCPGSPSVGRDGLASTGGPPSMDQKPEGMGCRTRGNFSGDGHKTRKEKYQGSS